MKPSWTERVTSSRYTWSALGGLLLAGSFPRIGLAGLAWVGPGWILFSSLGKQGGEAFRIGYTGGLVYYLASLYWLLLIPFPAGAVAGWLALSAYLALYPAVWVWLCWMTFPKSGIATGEHLDLAAVGLTADVGTAQTQVGVLSALWRSETIHTLLLLSLPRRILWTFGCAVFWVALEMVVARLFSGFPWNLLGVSQYQVLPLIQMVEVTGVYGVSFLLVWFAVSLGASVLRLLAQPIRSTAWVGDILLPLIAVLVVVAFGSTQLAQAPSPGRALQTVLIQPSIPQTLIWDTNQNSMRFTQLLALSERALRQNSNAQLLVWPEAAVPNMLRYELDTYEAITNLVTRNHVWMILGSDDAVPRPGSSEREFDFYNSSFLITPAGGIVGTYRKRKLVIFGEYIPFEKWLPVMKYLTPVGGSFAEGVGPVPFALPGVNARTSVLICFEDVFPHLVRKYVEPDTDFLLNLTNNGWFGESAAQWQHAANAVFRAVENRIPLVRCANNGLTCWVDSRGGMHEVFFPNSKDIYRAGFKLADVPLLPLGQKRVLTLYTRHGDWFGWGCVAGSGLMVGLTLVKARVQRRRAS